MRKTSIGFLWLAMGILLASVKPAPAIPAFARKYGLPCSACHAGLDHGCSSRPSIPALDKYRRWHRGYS